jgi:hypothetical protein
MGGAVGGLVTDPARVSRRHSHRRCARCGKVVLRRALVCKRCGKKQRVNPRALMLGLAGLFIISLFAFATVSQRMPLGFGRALASPGAESWSPFVPAPRATARGTLTASELWALYNDDVVAADARFKNKDVAVSGLVTDVRRDYRGAYVLRLSTGDALETVRATLAVHDDSGRSIPTRGQTVSVRCTGRGKLIGSPILDACKPL